MPAYDVVIAGYGPTGAVAANLLGASGHSVLVVDPELEIYNLPRAVHFDGEVMRIFQALGLAQPISDLSALGEALRFINGRGWRLFEQDLTSVPRQHGWFNNLFFNQPKLEQCLRAGVERYANVEIRLGPKVSAVKVVSEVELEIELGSNSESQRSELVVTRFLLACDGAKSSIRKMLDIPQEDLDCDEPWLVCDQIIEPDVAVDRTALQICDPVQPTSLIPCEGNHIRWEIMLDDDSSIPATDLEDQFRSLIADHIGRLSSTLDRDSGELIRAKVYKFHSLIAQTFQKDNVFLLGDAAHQMPPFLGQGMCAGIRDAYNLCWKLTGVLDGDYTAKLLTTYTAERRPHVRTVIATAVKMGDVIQTRNRFKAFVRDCYLMLGRAIPLLVRFMKFGEGWHLGDGLFAVDRVAEVSGPVGAPVPQRRLQSLSAQISNDPKWSDEQLGSGFTAIGFGIDPKRLLANTELPDWLSLLTLENEGQDELMSWAQKHGVRVALVRPDRQVYGVCKNQLDDNKVGQQLRFMLDGLQGKLQPN